MPVYVNQVGYLINADKHATISEETSYVLKNEAGEVVQEAKNINLTLDENSGEQVDLIDFSKITEPGMYYFETPNAVSAKFRISENVYDQAFFDSMKMFYFQRCGMELEEKYAGRFVHKACHTKDVSELGNPNHVFSCCGGWHDAGDYGRYTTAAAVALGHLLYAYEINPEAFAVQLNIPETGNGVPDILNECRYELEWMLKMQKEDGSVYHKCTSMTHTGFVMPEDDPLPFIVTPVSSLATADFAAIFAMASRIYATFDITFAYQCKEAAVKAFEWLLANPGFLFENPSECTTGGYDDLSDADERLWAYMEIYRLEKREECIGYINRMMEMQISTTALGWGDVAGFAALCTFTAPDGCFDSIVTEYFKGRWMEDADRLAATAEGNAFELAMHTYDFKWGSNMTELTNADKLMVAYYLSQDERYLQTALFQIDYIFGRNAMDTSYVTGEGERAFKHPHNRPTESDGIDEMIPGFVSGGPNARPCDEPALKMIPKGTAPMKCYVDDWGSYSTNEITIYWNSPLVLALSFICK